MVNAISRLWACFYLKTKQKSLSSLEFLYEKILYLCQRGKHLLFILFGLEYLCLSVLCLFFIEYISGALIYSWQCSFHCDGQAHSHMTDKLVILLGDPALPSLSLIDNGLISYLVYLLVLLKVIFVLPTAKETAEKKRPRWILAPIPIRLLCFSFLDYCLALICLFLL